MARKALVLITTSYPMIGDGSEAAGSFVVDLAEELAKRVPVRIVAPGSSSSVTEVARNLQVFRFAAPPKPLSTLKPWHPADLVQIVKVIREGRLATVAAVKSGPTAHVLALWALPSGYWASQACKQGDIGYSIWTLGSDIWTLGKIPLLRSYLGRLLRESYRCYSDGLKLAEDTRKIGGRAVDFLPSTRNIETQCTSSLRTESPFRLLFLGRWHTNKGVDLLLDALELIDETAWSNISSVHIAGGGPLASVVHAGVEKLTRQGRPVQLRGFLSKAEAAKAIAHADLVLIPSRVESIPVIFSDAVKLGRPVVTSPVGDLPALMERYRCGVVARNVSAQAFAEAIVSVVTKGTHEFVAGTEAVSAQFRIERVAMKIADELAGNARD